MTHIIQFFSAAALFFCCAGAKQIPAQTQKLVWDKNSEADLRGYKIYWGDTTRDYNRVVDVGPREYFHLSGFNDGKRRFFAVTAYDTAANESGYSSEVVWTAPGGQLPDTTMVERADNAPINFIMLYERKDTRGNPLEPIIRLQWEPFNADTSWGWEDLVLHSKPSETDYFIRGDTLELNVSRLKMFNTLDGDKYFWSWRFRVRLENPSDPQKATKWVYAEKSVRLVRALEPAGVPVEPIKFKLII